MKDYFYSLQTDARHDYLTTTPKKSAVLDNVKVIGNARILPDSYNRAVVIETETTLYLQSYDTLVCHIDKETGRFHKTWDGYSKTTLKHVNAFLVPFTGCLNTFSKKEWDNLEIG